MVQELSGRLQEHEKKKEGSSPPPPPGISLEEADQLKSTIDQLKEEITELQADQAAKENTNARLSMWCIKVYPLDCYVSVHCYMLGVHKQCSL